MFGTWLTQLFVREGSKAINEAIAKKNQPAEQSQPLTIMDSFLNCGILGTILVLFFCGLLRAPAIVGYVITVFIGIIGLITSGADSSIKPFIGAVIAIIGLVLLIILIT
jgi:divalent metal cation (Fe/Co/Zn/Cd) transporter